MSLQYSFFSFFFFVVICSYAQLESFTRKDLLLSLSSSSSTTFKIALFADLHYGENAWTNWGPRQDIKSDRVMSLVLDQEKPDFVVFLGDIITANNVPIANASFYWDQAISPTRKRGIPWATIFGNHDDAHFEWPSEWFSASGIPQVQCPLTTSLCSGNRKLEFEDDHDTNRPLLFQDC
eukprot:TRINITY_DN10798_c0_g1_i4.p1 TRINITY_DN10798_c0_g1~~TRINITY_DN10798_c0_g1_i4.p1  ORF type:complete len:204 (-),score=28.51 TRINITY_DN10798_c0_g1_i4:1422-1958(-)